MSLRKPEKPLCSGFRIFECSVRSSVDKDCTLSASQISRIISDMWSKLEPEQRLEYLLEARANANRYTTEVHEWRLAKALRPKRPKKPKPEPRGSNWDYIW